MVRKRSGRKRAEGVDALEMRFSQVSEGGQFSVLNEVEKEAIHEAALELLETLGLSQPIPSMIEKVSRYGGRLSDNGRLLFPRTLVERMIQSLRRDVILYGQEDGFELDLSGKNVYMSSGGASPNIVDLDTGKYRPAETRDLYAASRLVDKLENIHHFSRSVVATDAITPYSLDINTAYTCLSGTSKHVSMSISEPEHIEPIAELCYEIAGNESAFRLRPFMTIMVCHVVPPMRFAQEACETLERAVLAGFPVQLISAGQAGATSPAPLAGSLVQAVAETLAGLVFSWLVDTNVAAIFAPKPLVADLRTGAMSGGSGEQAILMAGAAQMGRFYNFPTSSIAGITDAKIADAQHGYEKNLAITLAAHAGSNLITQACGMQASLLGVSLEAYVIDNDMLGGILRTIRGIEATQENLAMEVIREVSVGEGHYLGHQQTLERMKADYTYPHIGDRRTPDDWEEDGALDMRVRAIIRTKEILAEHFPSHIHADTDAKLRHRHDFILKPEDMKGSPIA